MKKVRYNLCLLLSFSFFFISGCWDHKELNDQAVWLATGWDAGENGGIEISGQIVVPSSMQNKSGGMGKDSFTVAAKGQNVQDAVQNLQSKLSRTAFFGQRRVVIFGEELAKRGLKNELDANSRGTDVSLRTDAFILKGGTAKEALNLSYPLEKPPTVAALKEHEQFRHRGDTAFLNFLIAANSEGFRPTLPVLIIGKSQDGEKSEQILQLGGAAIFDRQLKLVGYLNNEENRVQMWMRGLLNKHSLMIPYKDGNASLNLTKMEGKIVPEIGKNNKVKFKVTLIGKGNLVENNTNLDLLETKNLKFLQKEFEKKTKERLLSTITKIQKEYGIDIFGFGEVIHQKKPHQWKSLKKDWDNKFSEVDVAVKVKLTIKQTGMTGPSILYKESELKR